MGRSCSRVLFNARVVWQRIPDYLYNAGDQITEWTGGWQQKDTYMAHNDYWFGNTPGAVSGLNGQLTINADNMKAYMPYDGQLYQGVLVDTQAWVSRRGLKINISPSRRRAAYVAVSVLTQQDRIR